MMEFSWQWLSPEWLSPDTLLSFDWQYPIFLWCIPAIPLLWIIRWLLSMRGQQRLSLAIPSKVLRGDTSAMLRFVPPTLLSIALAFLLLAMARPQKTSEQVEQWSEGIDIILAIDISESMEAQDFQPNRLEATKERAVNFINGRLQDRIGLVIFSGDAISYAPLTTDYDMLRNLTNDIKFKMIEKGGTAIGSAIAVSLNRLQESQARSKVMIVLSDGENNAGSIDPITAANLAYAYNIKIYTIGVGSLGNIQVGTDIYGRPIYSESQLDEPLLTEIAKIGGGQYYRATDNSTLETIFNRINQYEKSEIKETRYRDTLDYYIYYLVWGILFWLSWMGTKASFLTNALVD